MSEITCPYCDHAQRMCYDDGFGTEESVTYEMECSRCEKNFIFDTSFHLYHRTRKADCLNGAAHKWKRGHEQKGLWYAATCEVCEREQRFNLPQEKAL